MAKTYGNFTDFIDFSRASSGTYLGSDGLLKTAADNVPRVEYDANGNELGLLIEEQRTNLVTYSVYSATYSDSAVTVTSGTAPDGSSDGAILTEDTSTYYHRTRTPVLSVPLSSPAVASVYIKNISGSRNVYLNASSIMGVGININPSTGAINATSGSPTVTVENVGNETFRVSWTGVGTGNSNGVYVQINQNTSSTDEVYLGDGSSAIQVWGFQVEQGSFPTSYIPTSGATATRSADIASIATANFGYNQKAGTLVVEFALNEGSGSGDPHVLTLSDGTSSNRALLKEDSSQTRFYVAAGGVGQASIYNEVFSENTTVRSAFSLKADNFAVSTNGEAAETDVSGSMTTSITTIALGNDHDGGSQAINGHIKSIKYRPRRNSNTQLQEFTS